MKLPYQTGVDLILKAKEKERDQKLWEMWLTKYPYMTDKDSFISFPEFKERSLIQISRRPTDEILEEVEKIRKELGR